MGKKTKSRGSAFTHVPPGLADTQGDESHNCPYANWIILLGVIKYAMKTIGKNAESNI